MRGEELVVRSYARIFRLERRIYRIDRFVVPIPGGIPLVGLAYFGAALAIVAALGRMPAVAEPLDALPEPVRFLLLPAAVAILGTQVAPDGRRAHRFALSWIAQRLRPRRTFVGRRVPRERDSLVVAASVPASGGGAVPAPWARRLFVGIRARREGHASESP